MSSSGPRRLAAAALVAIALAGWAGTRAANEAQGPGRTADITWVDGDGGEHTASANRIFYVWLDRAYLSVPKDGKNYRDSERKARAFPTLQKKMKFSQIDEARFRWRTNEETGASLLVIHLLLRNGKSTEITGNVLAGASHPESPYLRFMDGEVSRRIELHPLGAESARQGKPRLVSIKFTT